MNDNTVSSDSILRRAGQVLIGLGLVDVAVLIYGAVAGASWSSGLGFFAIAAGFFVMRGSLRVASVVRWAATFAASAGMALVGVWPWVQPLELTLTLARLNPWTVTVAAAVFAVLLAVLVWVVRQLGRMEVLQARAAAGRPVRRMRIPIVLGAGLTAGLAAIAITFAASATAVKARDLAAAQLGSGYRYHVTAVNIRSTPQGTSVRGIVTAWSATEVRNVAVTWDELPRRFLSCRAAAATVAARVQWFAHDPSAKGTNHEYLVYCPHLCFSGCQHTAAAAPAAARCARI